MSRLVLALLLAAPLVALAEAPPPPMIAARAWVLRDFTSGQTIVSHNPDLQVEPASLTKLMTAYLAFDALKREAIALSQTVSISPRAWRASGLRMFVEPGQRVTVEELAYGMVVQSGNDATTALAELVGGSEEAFTQMMNRTAGELGLKGTHFVNASGWPDPKHYSTAQDLALLSAALIRDFPEYYTLYATKEYRYNNITQQNRNRLLWLDPNVDGVKTGHTDTAGYCLIASARRNGRRLISVVLGANSDTDRAQESLKLLNYGFQFYENVQVYSKGYQVGTLRVWKGATNKLQAVTASDIVLTVPRGEAAKIQAQLATEQPLLAPVSAGERVGAIRVSFNGKLVGEYPVVALETVPGGSIFGKMWDSIKLWW